METLRALNVINTMPSTYMEISNFVLKAKSEMLSGNYNPLDIEIQLKAMEECIKMLRADDDIRLSVMKEAEKYGKSFDYRGCKMCVKEVGVKYDYAATGDSTWAMLQAEVDGITEQKKAREKFLQNLPAEGVADVNTGELITPPPKTSKTTVAVTLK
jgi:PIN domain nuclease of toxin-antitoxin system